MATDLYWFDTGALDPAGNMAIDEALFLEGRPTIRFYSWRAPAYSIGYFQSAQSLGDRCLLVRRITGGGTVEHGRDLTFSLVFNLEDVTFLESVKKSYFWIHQAILEGLRGLRLPVEMYQNGKSRNGEFCFRSPCPGDLILEGAKVVGGAQRRRGRLLLHQGSVRLDRLPVERLLLMKAILEGLSHTFKLDLEMSSDILENRKEKIEVLKKKYLSKDWTYKY